MVGSMVGRAFEGLLGVPPTVTAKGNQIAMEGGNVASSACCCVCNGVDGIDYWAYWVLCEKIYKSRCVDKNSQREFSRATIIAVFISVIIFI